MPRKKLAPHPKGYNAQSFDPEGSGYDYETAQNKGLAPKKPGQHWPSRDPETGMLLKGRKHRTWNKLREYERAEGNEIFKGRDGRYYSKPKEE